MQRLTRFVPIASAVLAPASHTFARRYNKDTYVNKSAKKNMAEHGNQWIEAETDPNINKPEERYAHAREAELMRKLISITTEKQERNLAQAVEKRDTEVADLRGQIKKLQERLDKMNK